jgi:hypothetical protein
MIKLAMDRSLDGRRFAQVLRARRYDQGYIRKLVQHLIKVNHDDFAQVICRYMLNRGNSSFFEMKLEELQANQDI